MRLMRATIAQECLFKYLKAKGFIASDEREIQIIHDPSHDEENIKSPRAFCYTLPDEWAIYCSQAIERVAPVVRVGILLHENGHLLINAFGDEDSKDEEYEVDVDKWILDNLPEAGYHYDDHLYQSIDWGLRGLRTAHNVQHVAPSFIQVIREHADGE